MEHISDVWNLVSDLWKFVSYVCMCSDFWNFEAGVLFLRLRHQKCYLIFEKKIQACGMGTKLKMRKEDLKDEMTIREQES